MFMNQNCDAARRDRDTTLFVLMKLGFIINWPKSELEGSGYQGTLHRDDALTYRDGKAVSQAGRKINSNSFGSSPRAIVLQGTADAEDQRPV